MEVSAPTPPDPAKTAEAQTQSNKETAVANANLNRINQYAPQGSTTYNVIGSNEDGTPKYEQTTSYSPGEQAVYDTNLATRQNVGQIGRDQSQRIGGLLSTPFDLSSAADQYYNDFAEQRMDPYWDRRYEGKKTELLNSGITMGSDAYNDSMGQFENSRNDAYNSARFGAQGLANQAALSNRNQPINEISALMSGSQVSNPMSAAVPQVGMANTDVAGIYNQDYQNRLGAANMQNSANNAMMGGLFGLGSMGLYKWSDRRLKTDIRKVGRLDSGPTIYAYRYKSGGPVELGVMADEVEKTMPDAVVTIGGFKAVNYGKVA